MKKYIPSAITTLYLITTYLPLFGEVDRIASQWLTLSIVNGLAFFYLFFKKEISLALFNRYNNVYLCFIIFAAISLFYSINVTEGIIEISRHLNFFCALILFPQIIRKTKNPINRLTGTILVLILIQLLALSNQIYFNNPLIGLTGNKNIVAATLSMMLPFIWLYFKRFRSSISKIVLFAINLVIFVCLMKIGSKAAILSSSLIVIIFVSSQIFFYFKNKTNSLTISSISLISFIAAILITINQKNNIVNTVGNTINYQNDQGNLDRLRYYSETLMGFKENPFFGNGIGNWKIISIKYDAPFMKDYIVQYHAHNDFLQFLAETGIFGFIFYLFFFIQILFFSIKRLQKKSVNSQVFLYVILSLFVYIIDANLNFPSARVVMQINLISVFSLFLLAKNE